MTDKHFVDWESYVFGYGYGSGEFHIIPALVKFFDGLEDGHMYDSRKMEKEFGELAAWLLINTLCHADILDYGCSPRQGWLTEKGATLRDYLRGKAGESLYDLVCKYEGDHCEPGNCNCDPGELVPPCENPLWRDAPRL